MFFFLNNQSCVAEKLIYADFLSLVWFTKILLFLCSLELWGYKRVEELIWVKTNQLQRIIRTGRTGHWLNHSKEHCLVGIKGNPEVNRNIDTDVVVAEVRETSRKPDEVSTVSLLLNLPIKFSSISSLGILEFKILARTMVIALCFPFSCEAR